MSKVRIHYTRPGEAICLMCKKIVNSGLTGEPSTYSLTIWQNPPHTFQPCIEELKADDPDTTG